MKMTDKQENCLYTMAIGQSGSLPPEQLTDKERIKGVIACKGCDEPITEKYLLRVNEGIWHASCLNCSVCLCRLHERCYTRDSKIYCSKDFFCIYGKKCPCCEKGIAPTEVVRRVNDLVYHINCFYCQVCEKILQTGDEFYLTDNQQLLCKFDFEDSKDKVSSSDSESSNKRPRTTITAKQLDMLKAAYTSTPKPARHVREQLSSETGLDMRVVQVWFQNRRAKEKRLKRDANRRWASFTFETHAGKHARDIMVVSDTVFRNVDGPYDHCGYEAAWCPVDVCEDDGGDSPIHEIEWGGPNLTNGMFLEKSEVSQFNETFATENNSFLPHHDGSRCFAFSNNDNYLSNLGEAYSQIKPICKLCGE